MLETLITYLNALLEPLGFRTHGLTGQVSRGDKTFPVVYAKNGEFHPVNAEVSHVYHRLIDGPTDTDDPDDESPVNNTIVTRTYTIRCVAIFPFGLYGQDDQYEEDKAIRNLNSQLKHRNIKALKSQMKLIEVSAQPGASARGQDAWAEEFVGVEWKGKRHIVYVDYTVVFRGFSDCIVALGCGDAEVDVAQIIRDTYCTDVCDPATVSNSDDSYSQSVASGGALELPDINHVDSDGSTVPAPAQTVFTATPCPDPDPASITVNGDSPALEVDSGASQDIAVHNSAAADIGSRSGATVTIGDMTLDFPDSTTEALVIVPGNTVTIDPEFVFIPESGASSGSFTTPALDASFTVSAESITGGGSISNIVIDGAGAVSTFVGASFSSSVVVAFDITGTVNSVTLTF